MYSFDRPSARIMVTVALVALWLVPVSCGKARDSDVVRSRSQEGSTPSDSGTPADAEAMRTSDAGERIVFLGTSLTAGYGLDDPRLRFTDRIQEKIDSVGYPYTVVNAGVSGDTSAGGLRRVGWLLGAPVGVMVIELGANDGLRGLDVNAMRRNLQAVIDSVRSHEPDARIVLAGMEAPPNLGSAYRAAFRSVFVELSRRNETALIPFLLDGVAGEAALNQVDGIHPTAEGHRRVADVVWEVLEPLLREGLPESMRP